MSVDQTTAFQYMQLPIRCIKRRVVNGPVGHDDNDGKNI